MAKITYAYIRAKWKTVNVLLIYTTGTGKHLVGSP
jgi:hypothetical protein